MPMGEIGLTLEHYFSIFTKMIIKFVQKIFALEHMFDIIQNKWSNFYTCHRDSSQSEFLFYPMPISTDYVAVSSLLYPQWSFYSAPQLYCCQAGLSKDLNALPCLVPAV